MPKPRRRKGMTAEIALSLIHRVIEIQKKHPDMSRRVDEIQQKIHGHMKEIRSELECLDDRERDILTVSIINFIHEKAEESLLE